jgi:hypothetical protein
MRSNRSSHLLHHISASLQTEAITHANVNALAKPAATKNEPAQESTSAKDEPASTKNGRTGT